METLFVPLALFAGGLLAVQAGANAQLSKAVGSPFAATTLPARDWYRSAASRHPLDGNNRRAWRNSRGQVVASRRRHRLSRLCRLDHRSLPRLGAVVSVGLFIAGQMLASLTLDSFGLLGVPPTGLRVGAAVGTLVVLLGVAMVVFGQGGKDNVKVDRLGWIALALMAGAVLPVQGAVNALLRHDLGVRRSRWVRSRFSSPRSPWPR